MVDDEGIDKLDMPGRLGRRGGIADIYAVLINEVTIDSGWGGVDARHINYSYFVSMAVKKLINKFLKKPGFFLVNSML